MRVYERAELIMRARVLTSVDCFVSNQVCACVCVCV